jgi:Fungal chitosanase of glycosyl hydrolase group 75
MASTTPKIAPPVLPLPAASYPQLTIADWSYCQQSVAGQAIFIKGHGTFANMDIDCDGDQADPNNDGRCESSGDTQDETAFQDTVQSYGIPALDAYIHPYVVFGNEGSYSPTFNPRDYGVEPLSVMAVVCGDQLVRTPSLSLISLFSLLTDLWYLG